MAYNRTFFLKPQCGTSNFQKPHQSLTVEVVADQENDGVFYAFRTNNVILSKEESENE